MFNFAKIVGVATVSMMLAGAAQAQTAVDMLRELDQNQDNYIDQTEFDAGFASRSDYATWDVNQDGMIDETEYNRGTLGRYDADRDGMLNEQEFGAFSDTGIFNR